MTKLFPIRQDLHQDPYRTPWRRLEHFPFSYTGSIALPDTSYDEKSRGLKPAARNTETGNALNPAARGTEMRRVLLRVASLMFGLSLAACDSESKSPSKNETPIAFGTTHAIVDPPFIETGSMQTAVAERIAEARRAVVDAPTSAEAWGTFGAVCDIHELLTEANVCYRQAMALEGSDFRWPYLLAFVLERLGRERTDHALFSIRSVE